MRTIHRIPVARWSILALLAATLGMLLVIQPLGAQNSPPGAPTNLMARAIAVAATTGAVELTWTAPSAGRDSITHYEIETSSDSGNTWSPSVANTETVNTAKGVQTYHAVDAATAVEHLYRVAAVNSVGTGPVSNRASVTPPADGAQPDAPANLTATANGPAEINLSWTRLTGSDMGATSVTSYRIEHSKGGSLPWMELATVQAPTTGTTVSYSNTGLAPQTTRHYRVSAVNSAGRGPVSTSASAMTTLVGVPAAPSGLKAVAVLATGTDAVELTWTAPNQGRAPITGYTIESFADHDSDNATPNTWGVVVDNTESLGNDGAIGGGDDADNAGPGVQTYYAVDAVAGENQYRVSAINILGTGPVSAVTKVTPPVSGAQPGQPTGVTATPDGHSEINLVWVAPTNAGSSAITGYKIEYSKDGNLPWMDLATVGNVLRYNNTGLAPETTRHYRVSAVNSVGRGPVSSTTESGTPHVATTESRPTSSVPGKPTNLMARAIAVAATTGAVELTWTAPSAGRDSITHYEIEASSDGGNTWSPSVANTETVNTAKGVQTYHAVDAATAVEHLYRVAAVNSVGTGPVSTDASVTPPADGAQPDAPANLTATANGPAEINLSWTRLTDSDMGATSVTSYRIEHSKGGSLPWMELATVQAPTTGTTVSYRNAGLAPQTTRHYRVSAVNSAGRGPVSTSASAMTTLVGVPAAPSGLKAVAVLATGTDAVELTWTAPNQGSAPITGYRIESFADHDSDNATPNTWGVVVDNTESLGNDGAIGGGDDADNAGPGVQTYYAVDAVAGENQYRVSAINILGTGPVSAVTKMTPPVSGAQPDQPTGVTATPDGHSEIDLVWVAPTNAGSSAITGYKIEYSKDGNLPWMDVATVGNVLRYNNTGLAPETTRFYRVSAVNSVGSGPFSATPAVSISGTDTYNTVLTDHVATTERGPAFSVAGQSEERYAENGTGDVGTYTASGQNASTATWMLEGADAGDFTLSSGSGATTMLRFKSSPDYERPADANTDNVYMVTVKATANGVMDTLAVTVTVTDDPQEEETLMGRYDTNKNGEIDKSELATAVTDYEYNETLTKQQLADLVELYEYGS